MQQQWARERENITEARPSKSDDDDEVADEGHAIKKKQTNQVEEFQPQLVVSGCLFPYRSFVEELKLHLQYAARSVRIVQQAENRQSYLHKKAPRPPKLFVCRLIIEIFYGSTFVHRVIMHNFSSSSRSESAPRPSTQECAARECATTTTKMCIENLCTKQQHNTVYSWNIKCKEAEVICFVWCFFRAG